MNRFIKCQPSEFFILFFISIMKRKYVWKRIGKRLAKKYCCLKCNIDLVYVDYIRRKQDLFLVDFREFSDNEEVGNSRLYLLSRFMIFIYNMYFLVLAAMNKHKLHYFCDWWLIRLGQIHFSEKGVFSITIW